MLLLWTYFTSLEGATLILVSVPHSFVCVGGCDLTFWFRAVISGSVSRPDLLQASSRGHACYSSTLWRWAWWGGHRAIGVLHKGTRTQSVAADVWRWWRYAYPKERDPAFLGHLLRHYFFEAAHANANNMWKTLDEIPRGKSTHFKHFNISANK